MRILTATEASRGFSDLLDAVERGETVMVTRGNRTIARIAPVPAGTGRSLRAALDRVPRLDDAFEADIAEATALLTSETDPWVGD
ncbi:type II toxin-antitoxin system prevent-host-death family antitoxin [Cellulomonas sp. H30R-01]|uniref:Uncharacterized protein n=1 Tax=Cellulomonas algicola TaxID=2071633 RepID=A0A401UYS4_9CELL|nr:MULTISPECIES: type II toxin-antitoxin system prevent-host-death family antitoxin [Cellulomonas]QHT56948.1 type II toxin-antitoxin system prevent-host-death family antitoxin [Cellulomonas sp. H30R-01]GCD19792.1 hypothetical protein CTKZ_13540 [Cellulomonas algicola]